MTAPTPHTPPFRDPHLPFAKRIDDLLARLTLDEKIAFLHQFAPAVERLGVAAFRTGQEALHGVAWMGPATVFPRPWGWARPGTPTSYDGSARRCPRRSGRCAPATTAWA